VWSDGRDNEMDIYYAHGEQVKTTTTQSASMGIFLLLPLLVIFLHNYQKKKRE
jgi:hypothetical protein